MPRPLPSQMPAPVHLDEDGETIMLGAPQLQQSASVPGQAQRSLTRTTSDVIMLGRAGGPQASPPVKPALPGTPERLMEALRSAGSDAPAPLQASKAERIWEAIKGPDKNIGAAEFGLDVDDLCAMLRTQDRDLTGIRLLLQPMKAENIQLSRCLRQLHQQLGEVRQVVHDFFMDPDRREWLNQRSAENGDDEKALCKFFARLIRWHNNTCKIDDPTLAFYSRIWMYERNVAAPSAWPDAQAGFGAPMSERAPAGRTVTGEDPAQTPCSSQGAWGDGFERRVRELRCELEAACGDPRERPSCRVPSRVMSSGTLKPVRAVSRLPRDCDPVWQRVLEEADSVFGMAGAVSGNADQYVSYLADLLWLVEKHSGTYVRSAKLGRDPQTLTSDGMFRSLPKPAAPRVPEEPVRATSRPSDTSISAHASDSEEQDSFLGLGRSAGTGGTVNGQGVTSKLTSMLKKVRSPIRSPGGASREIHPEAEMVDEDEMQLGDLQRSPSPPACVLSEKSPVLPCGAVPTSSAKMPARPPPRISRGRQPGSPKASASCDSRSKEPGLASRTSSRAQESSRSTSRGRDGDDARRRLSL